MPQLERAASTFLPEGYRESLEPLREILDELDFPADPDSSFLTSLSQQYQRQIEVVSSSLAYFSTEVARVPDDIESRVGFAGRLAIAAFQAIREDLSSRGLVQMATGIVGYSEAAEDDMAANKGRVLADKIIMHRARHNATAILQTHSLLYYSYPALDDEASVWDRAVSAHDISRKKAPVVITDQENEALEALIDRVNGIEDRPAAAPVFKPSRLKYVNGFRLRKRARELFSLQVDSISGLIGIADVMVDQFLAQQAAPADLEPEEIVTGMRIAAKERRYIASAAIVDSSIMSDPTALCVTLLGQELTAHNLKAEREAFNRNSQKIAKRERNHLNTQ